MPIDLPPDDGSWTDPEIDPVPPVKEDPPPTITKEEE